MKHHLEGRGGGQEGNQAVSEAAGAFMLAVYGVGGLAGGQGDQLSYFSRTDGVPGIRNFQCYNWDSWSPSGRRGGYMARGEAGERGRVCGFAQRSSQGGVSTNDLAWLNQVA